MLKQLGSERVDAAARELTAMSCFSDMYNVQPVGDRPDKWIVRLWAFCVHDYELETVKTVLALKHDISLESFYLCMPGSQMCLTLTVTLGGYQEVNNA